MNSPLQPNTQELYQIYRHRVVTTDSRSVPPNSLFFALRGDRFNGNLYAGQALEKGAAYAVVDEEAIARELGDRALLVPDGLTALQQLANYHRRQLQMPILAITGSNGKTTTKELIASVMGQQYRVHFTQGNYNNHIGLPLTILQIGPEVEMAILEMGANHQGEIAELCRIAEPSHGMITNIGEAHLEGFGGIEGVKKGKGELYQFLAASDGVVFVNLDAEFLPEMAEQVARRINYKTSENPTPSEPAMETRLLQTTPNVEVAFLDENGAMVTATTHLPGHHNYQNVKAAIAIGKYFKVPCVKIAKGLSEYRPDNNRSERQTFREVDFFLDAYNANPTSTKAALGAFITLPNAPRAAILGDMLELGGRTAQAHAELADYAAKQPLEQVILVGSFYEQAAQQLGLRHFPDCKALYEWFWGQDWKGYTIFVKGSRGIGLEKLLQ